jgi:hypothetical protein
MRQYDQVADDAKKIDLDEALFALALVHKTQWLNPENSALRQSK